MGNYRITNLTDTLSKRDVNYMKPVSIGYIEMMIRKSISIKPGDTIYFTIPSLHISVHKLRMGGLISVVEVRDAEVKAASVSSKKMVEPSKPIKPTNRKDSIVPMSQKKGRKRDADKDSE